MCIIVYKPANQKFPSKETLQNCFINNPDGAGFMYAYKNHVYIKKGFDTFNKFWNVLNRTRKECGDKLPYIMHFRISTQAHGRMDCTHPFPLSSNMSDLRKLYVKCNIGIAHNGIIQLTSNYGYNKSITWSDTMLFITDYASLIIKDSNYYKDKANLKLLEKLAQSKLAILNSDGHVELIGDPFIQDNGIYYSDNSYKTYKPIVKSIGSSKFTLVDDDYTLEDEENFDMWSDFYDPKTKLYNFNPLDCPFSYDYDFYAGDEYCDHCRCKSKCFPDSEK